MVKINLELVHTPLYDFQGGGGPMDPPWTEMTRLPLGPGWVKQCKFNKSYMYNGVLFRWNSTSNKFIFRCIYLIFLDESI